jgi:hypothetical protein
MADININNIDAIFNSIEDSIHKALEIDVSDYVQEIEEEVIQSEFYDKYNPRVYKRRYENKGLIDKERNMKVTVLKVGKGNFDFGMENISKTNPYKKTSKGKYSPIYSSLESNELLFPMLEGENGESLAELSQESLNQRMDEISNIIKQQIKANGIDLD